MTTKQQLENDLSQVTGDLNSAKLSLEGKDATIESLNSVISEQNNKNQELVEKENKINNEKGELESTIVEKENNIEELNEKLKNQKAANIKAEAEKLASSFKKAKEEYSNIRWLWAFILGLSLVGFVCFLFFNPIVGETITSLNTATLIGRWIINFIIITFISFCSFQYSKADKNYDDFLNREVTAGATKSFLDNFGDEYSKELRENLLVSIPSVLFKNIEKHKGASGFQFNAIEKLIDKIPNINK